MNRADNETPAADDGLICIVALLVALALSAIASTVGLPR
jgi:hypothetical protein